MIIDISKWNGSINWSKVKASGVNGVIIRCGVGQSGVDTMFKTNIAGALAAGLKVGTYTYSKSSTKDGAIAEAKNTIAAVSPYKEKLYYPVFIDVEQSGTEKASKTVVTAFMETVKQAGYKTGVYCSSSWRKTYLSGVSADCWWIAQWSSKQPDCNIWQYSSNGKVNGITGAVDLDKVISYAPSPAPEPKQEDYEVLVRTLYYRPGNIMTGNDVGTVQDIVGATIDKSFGPATEKAVKTWQKAHGLAADGYFGPACWAYITAH